MWHQVRFRCRGDERMTALRLPSRAPAATCSRLGRVLRRGVVGSACVLLTACAAQNDASGVADPAGAKDRTSFGPDVPFGVQLCFPPYQRDLAQKLVNGPLTGTGPGAVDGVSAVSVTAAAESYAVGVRFMTQEARQVFLDDLRSASGVIGEATVIRDATAEDCAGK